MESNNKNHQIENIINVLGLDKDISNEDIRQCFKECGEIM